MVPDHWVPIMLMGRQQGWSKAETARVALGAGIGHVFSTLILGLLVWLAGLAVAARFGHIASYISGVALIGFGGWIAVSGWLELRTVQRKPAHPYGSNSHNLAHSPVTTASVGAETTLNTALHKYCHKRGARTALPLILGSSPMLEGIPAFFAAGKYGVELISLMALVFALGTILTYVFLCVYSTAGLRRIRFRAVERYGEVLSGALIALVGMAFMIWPVM